MLKVLKQMRTGCTATAQRRPVANVARLCFPLAMLILAAPWAAANERAQPPAARPDVLQVFVRDGCPHCTEAKEFLPVFSSDRPWLQIVYRSVDRDQAARDDLVRYSRNADIWPPGVPTFVFNNQVLMGFESPERTGPKLAALVAGHATIPGRHRDTGCSVRLALLTWDCRYSPWPSVCSTASIPARCGYCCFCCLCLYISRTACGWH